MITIIAALGKNNEIGKNNDLLWHLPNDLKFFKEKTTNHTVIMGFNTYSSIGKPLPNRKNIILTSKNILIENAFVYHNFEQIIKNEINNNNEVFIIGGVSLYNYFYPLADKMYLTLIDAEDKSATAYFPKIDDNEWKQIIISENEDNNIKYKHVLFERIKNE